MIKVSEYEGHAAECRRMAKAATDPRQKLQLEEMAEAWDALARDRAEHIRKGLITPAVDNRTTASESLSTRPRRTSSGARA